MYWLWLKIFIDNITPESRILLEKLTVPQLVKKLPAFNGTRRLLLHSQEPATCLNPVPNKSSPCPHPTYWKCVLILCSHLRLDFSSGSFPQVSLPEHCIAPLLPHTHATWLAYLLHLDLIIRIIFGEQYTSLSSKLCSLLHFPGISFFWGPNTYSRTPSDYVPPSIRETKFHTHTKQR